MEGVEYNTPPSAEPQEKAPTSSTSTSSSQTPFEGGTASSMHAPNSKGKGKEVTPTSGTDKMEQNHTQAGTSNSAYHVEWNKVISKKTFAAFFPLENAPGKDPVEKKINAFNLVGHLTSYVGIDITTISNTKYIKVTLADQADITNIASLHFPDKDNIHFIPYSALNPTFSPASNQVVKIHDIPLDIDKRLFIAFLERLDKVTSTKFHVCSLFYQCVVTFVNNNTVQKLGWSLTYGKHSFRCYPVNLSKEEYDLRRKYDLKLSNLPQGTTAFDLQDILKEVKGRTCFIPRRQDGNSYQKERFAYVQFETEEARRLAKTQAFQLKNRLLYFIDANKKTCSLCGSSYHMV